MRELQANVASVSIIDVGNNQVQNSPDSGSNESITIDRPSFFSKIPRFFRFDNAPTDATGLSLNAFARGHVVVTAAFIGPALLFLANQAAQEKCTLDNALYCQNNAKIHGFKPSSLLTNMATISRLIGAISLPVLGAVIDHTPYRRHVGCITAAIFTAIIGSCIALSSRTWFVLAILQACRDVVYQIHCVAIYSYASELGTTPAERSNYQSYYHLVFFVSVLAFMIEVLIPGAILKADNVVTGRMAAGICTVVVIPLHVISWKYLFKNRAPLSQLPPNRTLWSIGFSKLYRTFKMLQKDLPTVSWFLGGIAFSEAADSALPTVAMTYLQAFLKMSALEIGVAILVVSLFAVPGSFLGNAVATRYNPATSAKCAVIFYFLAFALASVTLTPPRRNLAYFYSTMSGFQ